MDPSLKEQANRNTPSPHRAAVSTGHKNAVSASTGQTQATVKRTGRRRVAMEYIQDKTKRHITFSKRKSGIMKKAYELSTLTGTQLLLLVASETGHVYTFATQKLQPLITEPQGKTLIQRCLSEPDNEPEEDKPAESFKEESPDTSVPFASEKADTKEAKLSSPRFPEDHLLNSPSPLPQSPFNIPQQEQPQGLPNNYWKHIMSQQNLPQQVQHQQNQQFQQVQQPSFDPHHFPSFPPNVSSQEEQNRPQGFPNFLFGSKMDFASGEPSQMENQGYFWPNSRSRE